MAYLALRLVLTFFTETFIMRIASSLLTMRSNRQYYLAVAAYYLVWAPLKELPLPSFVRILALFVYVSLPVAHSVGPLRTRLSRNLLIQLLVVANEMLAVVVSSIVTGGDGTMGAPSNPEDLAPILTAYAVLISVYACETEAVISFFAMLDQQPDADVEPPVFVMMLGSLGLIVVIYYRLFDRGILSTSALAVVTGYCVLSALFGSALITVAQRDARTKRTISDQIAEARTAKHVRGLVEEATRRSLGLRRLRHDLANQTRIVTDLVNEGRLEDADRYLSELQSQVYTLTGGQG